MSPFPNAGAVPLPLFPGAIGLTDLQAYPWLAEDGSHGGSPHMHLACTECYVVVEGRGRLQTMTSGGVEDVPLNVGDAVWFTPGTIHRTLNDDGALRVIIVMQNGGLPEAGDAVLTFPPEHLVDRESYARAASLVGADGRPSAARARARRDLAVEGFTRIQERWEKGDQAGLEEFRSAAGALVRDSQPAWRVRLEEGALAAARNTKEVISALSEGRYDYLASATVARVQRPEEQTFGMCGLLRAYDPVRIAAAR